MCNCCMQLLYATIACNNCTCNHFFRVSHVKTTDSSHGLWYSDTACLLLAINSIRLRQLRNHGVMNTTLQIVFKSVVIAKLVYAASASYGFCTAADRDRLEAVIRREIRSALCSTDQLSVRELIDDANDSLLSHLMNN